YRTTPRLTSRRCSALPHKSGTPHATATKGPRTRAPVISDWRSLAREGEDTPGSPARPVSSVASVIDSFPGGLGRTGVSVRVPSARRSQNQPEAPARPSDEPSRDGSAAREPGHEGHQPE